MRGCGKGLPAFTLLKKCEQTDIKYMNKEWLESKMVIIELPRSLCYHHRPMRGVLTLKQVSDWLIEEKQSEPERYRTTMPHFNRSAGNINYLTPCLVHILVTFLIFNT